MGCFKDGSARIKCIFFRDHSGWFKRMSVGAARPFGRLLR